MQLPRSRRAFPGGEKKSDSLEYPNRGENTCMDPEKQDDGLRRAHQTRGNHFWALGRNKILNTIKANAHSLCVGHVERRQSL